MLNFNLTYHYSKLIIKMPLKVEKVTFQISKSLDIKISHSFRIFNQMRFEQ